jgi:hypothetical protein
MAGGDADTPTTPGKVNIGALTTAAGSLFTFIAAVSLSGSLGRVVRNDGVPLEWAFAAVLLGGALLAASGLSATGKPLEVIFSIVGLELTLAGFIIAGVLAVRSGGHHERPSITATLDEPGRSVKGKVSVGTLASNARVVAVVQGVSEDANGVVTLARDLQRSDVGPNDEGKVELEFTARVPAGRYDAIRVAAWAVGTANDQATDAASACAQGKEPLPAETATAAGKGCVKLPLSPVPKAPALQAHWSDTKADAVEVQVTSSNASAPVSLLEGGGTRVAVVVKRSQTDGGFYRFYRAILRPDGDGKLDTKFKVPVAPGARRICVAAMYLKNDTAPRVSCHGSLNDFKETQAVVQLTRPQPTPTATATPTVDP